MGNASVPGSNPAHNPRWLGHVREGNFRPAPGNAAGPPSPLVPATPAPIQVRGAIWPLLALGGVLALASLVIVVPFLLSNTGVAGFAVGFVASLAPLAAVLFAVKVIDRWEPEPKRLLWFSFSWGAAVSIAGTLLIQPLFAAFAPRSSEEAFLAFMATVEAPIVEEVTKSLGLLLLLFAARKYFDGPVDGIVFAFTIAGGFAFTENILYFGRGIAESENSGGDFVRIFILRGIMSPFAHAIFTGTTGLIMGLAARGWHPARSVVAFFVGLIPAMILHNRWNSMGEDFLTQYILVQVPVFLLAAAGIVGLLLAERRLTRQRLLEYAGAGWFTPMEVDMLATGAGRRWATEWARRRGRGAQMREFIRTATDLACTRQRILGGRDVAAHQNDEARQLAVLAQLRAAVVA
ncbi:PrsW family intramembrane metalloprotease [Arthrobacter sp. M4]|nr:PrsW family intramembrane metalloprotease [Arthrobacter sp. M4]MCA4131358.1 PrsW family intramembrane metalloprotease [Arthrobacter sp. M4]